MTRVKTLDSVDELVELVSNNEMVVIDFWAPWCAPCKALAPIFEELSEQYQGVVFAKIDVQAVPEAAVAYSVRGIPAILGFLEGDIHFREAGSKRETLVKALDTFKQFF